MHDLQRNRLAWLTDAAWQQVMARNWDSQAQCILNHWRAHDLPLVLCTQRVRQMPQTVSLGLPAPTRWDRRKLALEVESHGIQRVAAFPAFETIALTAFSDAAMRDFLQQMRALQVSVQVYGSYGWQHLTGLAYVHPASDLDVIAPVPDMACATMVVRALHALRLPIRVDGELTFSGGQAIAWREYLQWIDGKVKHVLLKSRNAVQLADTFSLKTLEAACCL
jgi:phosphoribosyl-dephospho-CoA transferase